MRYFLDTSYLVAITHKRDQYHAEAVKIGRSLEKPVRLVTTEAILMEYGNMLSQIHVRAKAFQYMRLLRDSQETEIISADSKLFEKGLEDFGRFKDKEWGLVDCMSFAVMRERNILYALTSDEHFDQAGFISLMKSG